MSSRSEPSPQPSPTRGKARQRISDLSYRTHATNGLNGYFRVTVPGLNCETARDDPFGSGSVSRDPTGSWLDQKLVDALREVDLRLRADQGQRSPPRHPSELDPIARNSRDRTE